ncbi:hypothetical protein BH20CHL2_BH20CHL2_13420 [soil metagenome]
MELLILLALMIILAFAANLFGADSRTYDQPNRW